MRLNVFSIRRRGGEPNGAMIWTKAGAAFVNRDGSVNVLLDVWPIDGKLHIREVPADKRDAAPPYDAAMSMGELPEPNTPQAYAMRNAAPIAPSGVTNGGAAGGGGGGAGAVGAVGNAVNVNLANVPVEGHS